MHGRFLCGQYPQIWLLDHTVRICFALWKAAKLSDKVSIPFYILTSNEVFIIIITIILSSLILCEGMCVDTWHTHDIACAWRSEDSLWESSLPHSYGPQELDSDGQEWQEVPLTAESSQEQQ